MKAIFNDLYASDGLASAAGRIGPARLGGTSAGSGSDGLDSRLVQAFDAASSSTGTSFDYLLKTAQRESSMNPEAKASTSSATGLFQFIDSTWMETMKRSGAELGLGQYADQIGIAPNGNYFVANPQMRKEILDLRKDPEIASMMAGALTRHNAQQLEARVGRPPSDGELYIAHFLGASGASKLIQLAEKAPDLEAASLFPDQAKANPAIFYENGRNPRTVSGVYQSLVQQHDTPTRALMAMAGAQPAADNGTAVLGYASTPAADPSALGSRWKAADPDAAFDSLFRNDPASGKDKIASAFWRGFAMPPGLFAVAVAEDDAAAQPAATGAPETSVAAPTAAPAATPSLLRNSVERFLGRGPLDLSSFLKPEATGQD
ncbi:Transglycosylase SLT domain protein [Hartmannibacter diazotrophicus]|uniref:Transglycosylase SLT domain protein n=1 Tax=Hartmannibacter diazotrophicus TaxID=1482074 RepID=A0A2C9D584_9HYPH|nr:transglycosylase SLT domain-containing protein [Hartmannibacter diazotrophicus]SON55446.1 Transglycosylase SLT domain protein [Hartmannibacter diazotrophicus]